ncbi:MAG: glycosyltransferase [Candidatus Omnitrophica bacterium]|nr:glycosyltransferase [Candidatus Omnitrophota bacterium]
MAIPSPELLFRAALVFIGLVWVKRVVWVVSLRRLNPPLDPREAPVNAPKVSVVIPARNEEKNIARCLAHFFRQQYPDFEIVVVDDRSTDRTSRLLENFQKLSPVPFKIVRIEKLPQGWTGKNYAMFTGSKAAAGRWLLFTDADTTHGPRSIGTAVATALEGGIDFLTLAPQTECRSFWENTVQPLAVSSLALWFDPRKTNDDRNPSVLANGQFILIKKEVYEKLGGNESVKNEVVEDVEFAKIARAAGARVRFLNGTKLYATRMYSSLAEIKTGWTRIFTYLFNKSVPALLHKIFLFVFFSLLPFAALADKNVFFLALAVSLFIIVVRFIGNKMTKTNPWYAFLHPLGSLVMIWILLACVGRVLFRRPSVWRGQSYP